MRKSNSTASSDGKDSGKKINNNNFPASENQQSAYAKPKGKGGD